MPTSKQGETIKYAVSRQASAVASGLAILFGGTELVTHNTVPRLGVRSIAKCAGAIGTRKLFEGQQPTPACDGYEELFPPRVQNSRPINGHDFTIVATAYESNGAPDELKIIVDGLALLATIGVYQRFGRHVKHF